MINKEIILGSNGTIAKDFSDRNIPQNSHNQVCVSFLIPSNQFNDYDDYSVLTAVNRKVGNSITPLNALVLTASKSITIEGINYIKFSCILSLDYTSVIGELYFSPYVQATIHSNSVLDDLDNDNEVDDDEEVITETLLSQQSYTNCKLNIIRAITIQEDASLEEATTATTLAGQINSKKIYYNATWNSLSDASENMLYYNIATSYNPSVALYNGSIVAIKNQNVVSFYFPYLNGANTELLLMTNDGLFYKISSISRTGEGTELSPYVYSATKTQLTYTKDEVDTNFYKKTETYNKTEADNLLNAKVDKTTKVNGHALSGDITITKGDVGLGNVANYGVESATPSASGDQLYITSKAVYDALQSLNTAITNALNNKANSSDITSLDSRLDTIETLIGDNDGDDDNIINTLKEVIQTLSGLGEDANILNLINAKANQSDLTTLNNQINGTNGIKDKVDLLVARNNAYMEIKNSLGTIDILTSDWVVNSDANYPYKWELTNGYLEGAVNCIVVYSKDSDTSMLSSTTGIDEENGKLIIYASELPSDTISIEKIAVFNDLNAYINYSNEIVQQVLTNTSAISDINNTKLPQYVKASKEYALANGGTANYEIKYNDTSKTLQILSNINAIGNDDSISHSESSVELKTDGLEIKQINGLSQLGNEKSIDVLLKDGLVNVEIEESGTTHALTFDSNGDLKIDGNAVGGGNQLYQHNIDYTYGTGGVGGFKFTIISERSSAYDYASLKQYLIDKDATTMVKGIPLTGFVYTTGNSTAWIERSLAYNSVTDNIHEYCQKVSNGDTEHNEYSSLDSHWTDNFFAL